MVILGLNWMHQNALHHIPRIIHVTTFSQQNRLDLSKCFHSYWPGLNTGSTAVLAVGYGHIMCLAVLLRLNCGTTILLRTVSSPV